MGSAPLGEFPASAQYQVKKLKFSVLLTVVCAIADMVAKIVLGLSGIFDTIINSLTPLMIILTGIFMLSQDELLGKWHRFLTRRCCPSFEQCGSGAQCLL